MQVLVEKEKIREKFLRDSPVRKILQNNFLPVQEKIVEQKIMKNNLLKLSAACRN